MIFILLLYIYVLRVYFIAGVANIFLVESQNRPNKVFLTVRMLPPQPPPQKI